MHQTDIPQNTTLCNRNVHICAYFCYKVVHCGIWNIARFVRSIAMLWNIMERSNWNESTLVFSQTSRGRRLTKFCIIYASLDCSSHLVWCSLLFAFPEWKYKHLWKLNAKCMIFKIARNPPNIHHHHHRSHPRYFPYPCNVTNVTKWHQIRDVTCVLWHLKSLATRSFLHHVDQASYKETSKLCITWLSLYDGNLPVTGGFPFTKGQ